MFFGQNKKCQDFTLGQLVIGYFHSWYVFNVNKDNQLLIPGQMTLQ